MRFYLALFLIASSLCNCAGIYSSANPARPHEHDFKKACQEYQDWRKEQKNYRPSGWHEKLIANSPNPRAPRS